MKSSHMKTENRIKKTTSCLITNAYQANKKKVSYDVYAACFTTKNECYLIKSMYHIKGNVATT